MAKAKQTTTTKVHLETSKLKKSKNYKKMYRGQGR